MKRRHQIDIERDPEGAVWFRLVLAILCVLGALVLAQLNDDIGERLEAEQHRAAAGR